MRRIVRRSSETRRASDLPEHFRKTCDLLHSAGSERRHSMPHLLTVQEQHIPEGRLSDHGFHPLHCNKKPYFERKFSDHCSRQDRGIDHSKVYHIVFVLLIVLIFSILISLYKLLT